MARGHAEMIDMKDARGSRVSRIERDQLVIGGKGPSKSEKTMLQTPPSAMAATYCWTNSNDSTQAHDSTRSISLLLLLLLRPFIHSDLVFKI